MNFVLISLVVTFTFVELHQDERPKYDVRVFQNCFRVANSNLLEITKTGELQSPASYFFAQTTGFGNMLLEDDFGNQLKLQNSTKKKIKEILKSLQNETIIQDAFNNPGQMEVMKDSMAGIDEQRKAEVFALLSSDQLRAMETQLAYRAMCQFGLHEWLKANGLLDSKREQLIKQIAEKSRNELNDNTRETVVTYSEEILDLIASDSQQWKAIIGKRNQWLPQDPFLVLLQCHIKHDDLKHDIDTNKLFGKLVSGELNFTIGINGAISVTQDKMALANGRIQILIAERNYGGIDLTKSQVTEINRATIPTKAESAELALRMEKIREKLVKEGFEAVKDETITTVNEMAKWCLERVENTLLDHQLQALNTIVKRRIVGVCGLDLAIDKFVLSELKDGAKTRDSLNKKREAYTKKITSFHNSFANSIWKELIKSDPNLLRDIKQKAPDFRFEEIENPSLLFRM